MYGPRVLFSFCLVFNSCRTTSAHIIIINRRFSAHYCVRQYLRKHRPGREGHTTTHRGNGIEMSVRFVWLVFFFLTPTPSGDRTRNTLRNPYQRAEPRRSVIVRCNAGSPRRRPSGTGASYHKWNEKEGESVRKSNNSQRQIRQRNRVRFRHWCGALGAPTHDVRVPFGIENLFQ